MSFGESIKPQRGTYTKEGSVVGSDKSISIIAGVLATKNN
jgi:hypothetical protein